MQDHRNSPPTGDELTVQRAVMALALEAWPDSLSIPNLAREIDTGEVEVAVRDLVGVGLLECSGLKVRATEAAVHLDGLELP